VSTTQYITRRDLITALRSALAKYEKRRQKEDLEPQIKEHIKAEISRISAPSLIFMPAQGLRSGPPAGARKVVNMYVTPDGKLFVEYDV